MARRGVIAGTALAGAALVGGIFIGTEVIGDSVFEKNKSAAEQIQDLGKAATEQCNELANEKVNEKYPGTAEPNDATKQDEVYDAIQARNTEGQVLGRKVMEQCLEQTLAGFESQVQQTTTTVKEG